MASRECNRPPAGNGWVLLASGFAAREHPWSRLADVGVRPRLVGAGLARWQWLRWAKMGEQTR
jgi:hypothetical protein